MSGHRIIFAEPMLAFGSGHFLRAIEAVARLAAPVPIQAFVSKGLRLTTDVANLQLVPHFGYTVLGKTYLPQEEQKDGLYLDPFVEGCLAEATGRDHFFVQSADVDMVSSLLRAIGRRQVGTIPAVHLRYNMLNMAPFNPEPQAAAVMAAVLAEPKLAGRVHLYAELPAQIDYIRARWGARAELFADVPGAAFLNARPRARAAGAGGVRIGYIGDSRKEKGADIVPSVIQAFEAAHPDLAPTVTWVMQLSGRFSLGLAQPIIDLSRQAKGRFEFHVCGIDGISGAIYDEIFHGLDMVILPYALANYATRGSGVAVEAAYASIPFVHTAGCAFGAVGGDAAVAAAPGAPFVEAIARVAGDLAEYQARAARAREGLLAAALEASLIQRLRRPAA